MWMQGQKHGIRNGIPSNSYAPSTEEEDIWEGMVALHNVGWEENNVKDGGWDGMMEDFRDMRQATNTND
jgi:hypothetical protein